MSKYNNSNYNSDNYDPNCRLIIKNLPKGHDPDKIKKLLLELATQVAPVYKISINKIGLTKNVKSCFIDFVYDDSVIYAKECLAGTKFFGNVLSYEFAEGSLYLERLRNLEEKKNADSNPNTSTSKSKSSTNRDRISPKPDSRLDTKPAKSLNGWKKASTSNRNDQNSSKSKNSRSNSKERRSSSNSRNSSPVTNNPPNLSKVHQPTKTPLFKIRQQNQQNGNQNQQNPVYGIQNGNLQVMNNGNFRGPNFQRSNMPPMWTPPNMMVRMPNGGNPMMATQPMQVMPNYYQNAGQMGKGSQGKSYYR